MVVSWARAILSISKKPWTFPARPYYCILSFPKINRKPNNSKAEGRKGHTGPLGQPRGEELPCRFLSRHVTLSPGQPRGDELPCRFLSHLWGSGGDILGPLGQPHVRKSCLARSSLIPWPCHGLGASRRLPTENYMLDSRKNNFAFKHNSKCMSLLKVLMGKWSFMKW